MTEFICGSKPDIKERLREMGDKRKAELLAAGCAEAQAEWCLEHQAAEYIESLEAVLHGIWVDVDMILKGRDSVTGDHLFSTDNTRILESIRKRAALEETGQ